MTLFSLQFHALPSELAPLVQEVADLCGMYAIAVDDQPFRARVLASDQIETAMVEGASWRILLVVDPPTRSIETATQLDELVLDPVILNIGRHDSGGLGESMLSGDPTSPATGAACKQLAKRLRAMTTAGVRGVARNGASAWYRNHRYSDGAKNLYDHGVPLRPVAGTSRIELDPAH